MESALKVVDMLGKGCFHIKHTATCRYEVTN